MHISTRVRAIAALGLAALTLGACSTTQPAPASSSEAAPSAESRTVTDASGQEVTLPAHPSRVVTLSEPTTDNALAAASRPSPTTSSTAPETSRSSARSVPPTSRPSVPLTRI